MTIIPTTPVASPGYRRRLRVEPSSCVAVAMLEDDMHCMAVTLQHAEGVVTAIEARTIRAPWDTCPGARAKLTETFLGARLDEVTARREKKQNCTHLHDLAVLAAAHAGDATPITWDIRASDPVDGERVLTIFRDGSEVHRWTEQDGRLISPLELASLTLLQLREWIASLDGEVQEAARLLQWGGLVAHGRTIPLEQQSVASALPANCYTFQPERAVHAKRIGRILDFSDGTRELLAGLREPKAE
jgi:hypothetical protein